MNAWHAIGEPAHTELLCVVGPTASGKTELAIRLCERFGGEVVSADSVQIYEHFDIGSGKPTQEELARARHHLIGVVDPLRPVDAAWFAGAAEQTICDIRSRGKVPIVCGGTFLWVRALLWGLADAPGACAELRTEMQRQAQAQGRDKLHARLALVDPESAARLDPNDFVRVQRALEVFELTGRRLSELQAEHRTRPARHHARLIGVHSERNALEARMRARAEQWLANGWIEEVEALAARGYVDTRPMASVGYRQVLDYVQGRLPRERLLEEVFRATKVFARRQRTWLRDQPVVWVEGP